MTDFPIILCEGEVHGEVYGITGAFVGYVNDLIRGGVQTKDLPGAFLDLYALDFYYWQVCNGGHSQFVGNAGARLQADLDHAIRGAALIGMPDHMPPTACDSTSMLMAGNVPPLKVPMAYSAPRCCLDDAISAATRLASS